MQKPIKSNFNFQILCTVALFLIFAVCSLFLIILSATTYKGMNGEADKNFDANTSVRYISSKLASADYNSDIIISKKNDISYLSFDAGDEIPDYEFVIYYKDGYIYELLKNKTDSINFDYGNPVIKSQGIDFEVSDENSIKITSKTQENNFISSYVSFKCANVREVS